MPRPKSTSQKTPSGDESTGWVRASADVALQLDSMTNNTSLALAIERVSDGRILLFPADAQQGNWLSWHAPGMKWTFKDGAVTKERSAAQLLAETVFYKVGHHSSHNATAKEKGLEMMQKEDETRRLHPSGPRRGTGAKSERFPGRCRRAHLPSSSGKMSRPGGAIRPRLGR